MEHRFGHTDCRNELSVPTRHIFTTFGSKDLLEPTWRLYAVAVKNAEFTVFTQHINEIVQTEQKKYPTLVEVIDSCC